MNVKDVHISTIKAGDTVIHNGELSTVCPKDLNRGFCGVTLFGDSYRSGAIPIKLVDYSLPKQ